MDYYRKQQSEQATERELVELAVQAAKIDGEGTLTEKFLNDELKSNFGNDNEVKPIENGWKYITDKKYLISSDGKVTNPILPDEYQQVEYIESTGSQWIDTKLVSTQDERKYFDIDFEVDFLYGTTSIRNPIGSQHLAFNTYFLQVFNSKFYMFKFNINTDANKLRNHIKFYLNNWYINDELKSNIVEYPTEECNIYLFKWEYNLSVNKLYSCMFYDENKQFFRNYIPCYSTTTVTDSNGDSCPANTKGLYDLVEGKFYTNQGDKSVDFIAGPDVN